MNTRKGFYIRLNDEEVRIIAMLKKNHSVNISQLFKNAIKECLEKMSKEEKR